MKNGRKKEREENKMKKIQELIGEWVIIYIE